MGVISVMINDLENRDFHSNFDPVLTFKRVIYGHFEIQKSRILDIFHIRNPGPNKVIVAPLPSSETSLLKVIALLL